MEMKAVKPYGKGVLIKEGETVQFKDFAITFLCTKTKSFTIGGIARSNSTDYFEIKYKENEKEIVKKVEWQYGFHGDLAEHLGEIAINGKKVVIDYMNGVITATEKND